MRDVVIYTTAGGAHGLGHVTRMHTLALALQQRGVKVAFVSATARAVEEIVTSWPVSSVSLLERAFHKEICVRRQMLICDTKEMIPERDLAILRQCDWRIVRIDHPHASAATADLVVLPGIHYAQADIARLQRAIGAQRVLHGADYVLLSQAVASLQPLSWDERHNLIVYCAGGTDAQQAHDWYRTNAPRLDAQQVYGPCADQATYLRQLQHARLVVSLFGVTAYEALSLRVPLMLCGTTAENIAACTLLEERYGIPYGGEVHGPATPHSLSLHATVQRYWQRLQESGSGRGNTLHIDNRGAERVADAIMPLLQH